MMRLSCNGCRVLRKGCTDACTIRPCLQWINSPDAQANATVFLAKFYGRAGLLNLIAAAPNGPAVFRSLLYEACGRIVNPVYGAVGLLWSGTWHMCQEAVEAVLKGAPIVQQQRSADHDDAAAAAAAYDIRHVFPKPSSNSSSSNKQHSPAAAPDTAAQNNDGDKHTDRLHLLNKQGASPSSLKRTSSSSPSPPSLKKPKQGAQNKRQQQHLAAASPDSSNANSRRGASSDDCDRHSASDTEEAASHVSQAEQQPQSMGLDLTLGLVTSSAPPTLAFRFL